MMTRIFTLLFVIAFLSACSSSPEMRTVPQLNVERFMGKWFVIANIPTWIERGAHNATETYQLSEEGRVLTTFEFNKDGFDGEKKRYNPVGTIVSEDNATWTMQFVWPFEADFRVIYLDENYQHTVIGRSKRDYVWVMARSPVVDPEKYAEMLRVIEAKGYDLEKLQRVPHDMEDKIGMKI